MLPLCELCGLRTLKNREICCCIREVGVLELFDLFQSLDSDRRTADKSNQRELEENEPSSAVGAKTMSKYGRRSLLRFEPV